MKVLFIGGTGNISLSSTKLALERGIDIFLLTRGTSQAIPKGVKSLIGDINDEAKVKELIKDHHFDTVVNWIAFGPEDINRDFELFRGKTNQ